MRAIRNFRGKYYFLSNFYYTNIVYEDIKYTSVESAFQSAKTLDKNKRLLFKDLQACDAKHLGRKIELRNDWEEVKDDIMYELCLYKFTYNKKLRKELLAIGERELIEGNIWHDNHYGNCVCQNCTKIKGENILGKILMRIRSELI